MDVSPVLVADLQAPEAVEPGERPFDHPAVASQAVLGLDTTAGDAGDDAALAQGQTEVTVVVTLVGMELVRSATGPAARLGADGLDGVDGGEQHLRIVHVRGAHQDRERDAVGVDHKMALRALFAAIRWVLARFLAPLVAGTAAESSAARSQSIRSAWASSSRSTWCSLRQTPVWYQSRGLRQHGIPLPHPISAGKYSQRMPVFSTNRIPVSAARSDTRGRPPLGFGGSGGSSGATRAHNASGNSSFAMAPSSMAPILLPWLLTRRFC